MGDWESLALASVESTLKYHPAYAGILTRARDPGRGQCLRVSLTGAVSSQMVTEEREGTLSTVGNRASSVWVEECLTVRPTSRAGTKVGPNDPMV